MPLTKEEWARRHLINQGNKNPKQESILYIISLLDEDSNDPEEQSARMWLRAAYKRNCRVYEREERNERRRSDNASNISTSESDG